MAARKLKAGKGAQATQRRKARTPVESAAVRLRRELTEARAQRAATAEILKLIARSPSDVQPVFDAIAASAMRLLGGMSGAVTRAVGDQLHLVAHTATRPEVLEALKNYYPRPLSSTVTTARVLRTGKPEFRSDYETDPETQPETKAFARARGFRSNLWVPLLHNGVAFGTINVTRREAGPFSEHQIKLLETFADQAVIAIENARLFNETKEALERQTATAEILKVIASSPSDVQPVFDTIVETAKRLIGAFSVTVTLVDREKLKLAAYTATGPEGTEALRKYFPISIEGTPMGKAVRQRAPEFIDDFEKDPTVEPAGKELARVRGFKSVVFVPMVRNDVAIGSLNVTRREAGRLTEHQLDLLKTFADQAVIAIENVRLFNETKEGLERQTATAEILKVISSSPTDVQPVFEAIAERARVLCGGIVSAVARFDGEQVHLVSYHGVSREASDAMRTQFPMRADGGAVTARAILERVPVQIADVLADPRYSVKEAARLAGYRSTMAVPMLREGEVIGSIAVNRAEAGMFPEKQVNLLQTFAAQAVIAIENVRLFNETREALERQTATAEILGIIARSPSDVQPIFEGIVASAMRLVDGHSAALTRVAGDRLQLAALTSTDPSGDAALRARFPRPVVGPTEHNKVIRTAAPVHIADTEAAEHLDAYRKLARARGFRSNLIVPLVRMDEVIGTLSVTRKAAGPFSEHQIALLKTFADQAVIAIENVRLFNETKEALERQTATSEVLAAISGAQTDASPVIETIARSAHNLSKAVYCTVLRYDGKLLHIAAVHGFSPEDERHLRTRYPVEPGDASVMSGRVILSGRVEQVDDVQADSLYDREHAAILGLRRMLGVPMLREGSVLGVIVLGWQEPGRTPTALIDLLKTFADQAVIAIENVRLFNETREALERQTATSEILQVIAASPSDVQPVFDTVAQKAVDLCGSGFGVVTRFDGELVHVAAISATAPAQTMDKIRASFPVRPSRRGAASRCILTREIVHMPDVMADPEYQPDGIAKSGGINSILAVPLLRDGAPLGSVSVARTLAAPFTPHQIALLKTFADQAVIAIENVRLFNETKEALERQTATAEILKVISESPTDVQPVFDAIAASAVRLLNGYSAAVFRVQDDMFHLAALTSTSQQGDEALRSTYPRPVGSRPRLAQAVRTGSPLVHRDMQTDPAVPEEVRASARARGHRSNIVVPMMREGAGIGFISVARREAVDFSAHQIELLKTFADQAVIAIENVRLFNETKEALERQTATANILSAISGATMDAQPVFETIVHNAARLCSAVFCNVQRYDGEQLHIEALHGDEDFKRLVSARYPKKPHPSELSGRVVAEKRVVHIPDAQSDPLYDRAYAVRGGWRRMLAVPMMRGSVVHGVIVVAWREAGSTPEAQVDLLKTFADQAVIAIENVRLFKELQSRTEALTKSVGQLTALGEVGQAISSTLELDKVLQTIVERAVKLTGLDNGSIYEYDEQAEEFRLQAADSVADELLEAVRRAPIRKGDGTVGRTAVTREAAQVPDILDEGYQSSRKDVLVRAGYRAILTVPLLHENRVMGALSVTRKTPGVFAPEIVELLKTFATQSAMAIQNARLFREI
ncbi:MAG TPA: GAF domain-containing protein, partial [Casimicrobiaceae bacterium]|nr:GAF domain-containing protein [Casimicrobiaceae bacterium]